MKKKYWLFDILFNLLALAILIVEFLACYYVDLMTTFVLPFFAVLVLLIVNVYFSYKEKSYFVIWRVVPCGLILYIGWLLASISIDNHHLATMGTLNTDPMSYVVCNYFYVGYAVIIFAGLLLWQGILLVGYIMNKKENNT